MKTFKDYNGWRYCGKYLSTPGIYLHTIDVFHIEHWQYNNKWITDNKKLFAIEFQSSDINGKGIRAYAFHINDLYIGGAYSAEALKLLSKLADIRTIRELVGNFRKLKLKKLAYSAKEYKFFPQMFQNHSDLFFEALASGIELKK